MDFASLLACCLLSRLTLHPCCVWECVCACQERLLPIFKIPLRRSWEHNELDTTSHQFGFNLDTYWPDPWETQLGVVPDTNVLEENAKIALELSGGVRLNAMDGRDALARMGRETRSHLWLLRLINVASVLLAYRCRRALYHLFLLDCVAGVNDH